MRGRGAHLIHFRNLQEGSGCLRKDNVSTELPVNQLLPKSDSGSSFVFRRKGNGVKGDDME